MISVYADIGGTFTDIVMNVNGHESLLKIPTLVCDPSSSLVSGIISLLKGQKIMTRDQKNVKIDLLAHSTTIATNAILGQTGLELPRAALVTTKGFRDILEIGRQNRSSLYDLQIERRSPLIRRRDRYEVKERIDITGREIDPLSLNDCMNVARKIASRKINHIAISFLHSYKNPDHETSAKRVFKEIIPNCVVDCSNEVDPEYREYERTSTTVVNLILKPIVSEYISKLAHRASKKLKIERNCIVQSNGGLVSHEEGRLFPAKLIESGPASGLIASAVFAKRLRLGARILSFDMGGTTAKVGTVIGGRPEETMEFEVGGKSINGRRMKGSGYPVRFPFLDLVEVSAGGGTIAWADKAGRLRVGPISSGADPGPACYGKGSFEPTVTDANLVLGRLPKTIVGGRMRLDPIKARESIRRLNRRLNPCFATVEDAAIAIISLANHEMLRAMRIVTMERGLDPTEFMLVCFGGAGPLHGCELAQGLGISKLAVPLHPGTFSAEGVSFSKIRHDFVHTTYID